MHMANAMPLSKLLACSLQEAFRKAAIAALTNQLQQSVGSATAIAGSELDSLFSVQANLSQ